MGNEQGGTTNQPQNQNNYNNQNNYPTQENFMKQIDFAIEQNSSNNSVTKPQFNRILSLLGLDAQSINYIPILDGLFEMIEPVNITQAKPKYNVKMFMNKVINDNYFLIQCRIFLFGLLFWIFFKNCLLF
jgi:hypothetical protein